MSQLRTFVLCAGIATGAMALWMALMLAGYLLVVYL